MSAAPRIVLIAAAAALAASIGLLWFTDIPLGVPGEWTWTRMPFIEEHAWGWMTAGVAAALYLGFVALGSRMVDSRRPTLRVGAILLLAAAGFCWLFAVQSAVPGLAGLPKSTVVLFNRGSSGYFWQARYEVEDTRAFLAGYQDLVAQGDYLHIGTHPPGLTLLFRGLIETFDSSPALTAAVLATEPESVHAATDILRRQTVATGRPFSPADEAVLWCAALLANAAAAATIVPLFMLLTQFVDRRTAWFAAALWPLVPGVAVFLPKSDAVFPLISMLGPCLWLTGWRRHSPVLCVLSGLVLFGGMLLSLAIAPIAVLTGLATLFLELRGPRASPSPPREVATLEPASVGGEGRGEGLGGTTFAQRWSWPTWLSSQPAWRWWLTSIGAAAIGFFTPVLLLWSQADLNLPQVWSQNVTNHAAFYDHFTRTWWKWLLVNPLEAALAAGAPLAIIALAGGLRSRRTPLFPLVAATAVVWGLLWLSGKNSGEAARLWLLFQPWLVIAAAAAFINHRAAALSPADRPAGLNPAARERSVWLALLTLQAIACVATVTRVDGFDLSGL